MAQVLFRQSLHFEDLSFIVLKGAYAEAIAVQAYPSVEAASIAYRFVDLARSDGTLKPFGSLAVAFRGRVRPDRLVINVLREACVYIVTEDLADSADDNALSFLDDVEARMPEVFRIVGSVRRS